MNAGFYEAQINAILTAQLPAQVEIDELGNTVPANEYRAGQLADLSQSRRRIAWTQEAKARAWLIAEGRSADWLHCFRRGNFRPHG